MKKHNIMMRPSSANSSYPGAVVAFEPTRYHQLDRGLRVYQYLGTVKARTVPEEEIEEPFVLGQEYKSSTGLTPYIYVAITLEGTLIFRQYDGELLEADKDGRLLGYYNASARILKRKTTKPPTIEYYLDPPTEE